ncbi:peptidoglycan-binding domain-containing protein [Streptomyces harbinensis]|uniref:peptidoglycan-binding domain-containing protein n=1 Tax=Streptomyces harbinensis TaxID=1176198 RepID=UPI0034DDFEC3
MRPKRLTKTLVTFTALAAIGGTGLMTAGSAHALPAAPVERAAVTSDAVTPLEVVNLGLTTREAMNVQCALRENWDYNGPIDGLLGTESWKAFQRLLQARYGYTGAIDGIVGPGTISALQRALEQHYDYAGGIDGIAGPETTAALKLAAADAVQYC